MIQSFKLLPNLQYFRTLTTKIGMLQHGNLNKPDPAHGYSIDDNARAMVVALQIFELYNDSTILPLIDVYIGYLEKAKLKNGFFHNFSDKNGMFLDKVGSETSTGRAIWALGYAVSREKVSKKMAIKANSILQNLPSISSLFHIRSKAYALIGYFYLKDKDTVSFLADQLVESFNQYKGEDWFEDLFEYANGILPYSLFLAYLLTNDHTYRKIAEKSFLFLDKITRDSGLACPISHTGRKIGSDSIDTYDQQAIEAADMVLAARAGFLATSNTFYQKAANDWFAWFSGNNINKVSLINKKTGAAFDGITKAGVNENNGAESVLCYLLAYNAMASDKVLK